MFYYKIITPDESNPMLSVIEKSGLTSEFTLQTVLDQQVSLKEQARKNQIMIDAYSAQTMLLENRHPEYADIDPANYETLKAYCEKKMQIAEHQEFMDEIAEIVEKQDVEISEIMQQFGIDMPEEPVKDEPKKDFSDETLNALEIEPEQPKE